MSDEQQELLSLLQSDPAAAQQLIQTQLAERAASHPGLAMMLQLMASRPVHDDDAQRAKRARAERVRAHIRELRSALASAHELLDDLASALGACALCWGGDDGCPTCRGRGNPGFRVPDGTLFDELVAPAIARKDAQKPGQGRESCS